METTLLLPDSQVCTTENAMHKSPCAWAFFGSSRISTVTGYKPCECVMAICTWSLWRSAK